MLGVLVLEMPLVNFQQILRHEPSRVFEEIREILPQFFQQLHNLVEFLYDKLGRAQIPEGRGGKILLLAEATLSVALELVQTSPEMIGSLVRVVVRGLPQIGGLLILELGVESLLGDIFLGVGVVKEDIVICRVGIRRVTLRGRVVRAGVIGLVVGVSEVIICRVVWVEGLAILILFIELRGELLRLELEDLLAAVLFFFECILRENLVEKIDQFFVASSESHDVLVIERVHLLRFSGGGGSLRGGGEARVVALH